MRSILSSFIQNPKSVALLLLSFLALLALRLADMGLAHHWDEAFPYSYAIGWMTQNGPSLLSSAAPTEYTTGHPLLYYFLQSTWNWLVGSSFLLQRMLPLTLAAISLMLCFKVAQKIGGTRVGWGAMALLLLQSTFLAQSTFQLPEMLLTALTLLTIYAVQTQRGWWLAVGTTGMLLTKEPAVILLLLIWVFDTFSGFRSRTWSARFKQCLPYAMAVAVMALFYLHQYAVQGWFLFPRHTGFMTFTWEFFSNQLRRYAAHLFIYDGRNILTFGSVVLSVLAIWKCKAWWKQQWHKSKQWMVFLLMIMVGFLLFSAFNFYSNRYILVLFPMLCILVAQWASACVKWPLGYALVMVVFISASGSQTLVQQKPTDHSLGYATAVRLHESAVDELQVQGWQHEPISCGFLMSKYLSSAFPGYVAKGQEFSHVSNHHFPEARVLIYSSMEHPHVSLPEGWSLDHLMWSAQDGGQWIRIYRRGK